jgi:hypothetical protein
MPYVSCTKEATTRTPSSASLKLIENLEKVALNPLSVVVHQPTSINGFSLERRATDPLLSLLFIVFFFSYSYHSLISFLIYVSSNVGVLVLNSCSSLALPYDPSAISTKMIA